MANTLLLTLTLLGTIICCCQASFPVVLVVLDGFRHDYLSIYSTPNLDRLVSEGVLAPRLQAEFPAEKNTFLVSLLTGHHTEDHGIFADQVFSSVYQDILDIDDANLWNKTRELGTIWDLMGKNERLFRVCNWPHAQHIVPKEHLDGVLIFNAKELQQTTTTTTTTNNNGSTMMPKQKSKALPPLNIGDKWNTCVEATLQWLLKGEAQLVSLFLEEPGRSAELFGPDSMEVADAVGKVDKMIGQLITRMQEEQNGLWPNKINLVITSTPGYVTYSYDHAIDLSEYVTPELYMAIGESPVLNIRPLEREIMVYEEIKKGETAGKKYKVHIKEEFPEASHYAKNDDVQELIVVAAEGYAFAHDMKDRIKDLNAQGNRSEGLRNTYGISGYNNTLATMQTLVIAHGPDMADGGKVPMPANLAQMEDTPLRVVDLFVLLCKVLDLDVPSGVPGDLNRVTVLLRNPYDNKVVKAIRSWVSYAFLPENAPITIAIGVCILLLTVVVVFLIVCISRRCRRAQEPASTTGYRYTQVKNNRRTNDGAADVNFEGTMDDKQGLLTEVPIGDEDDYGDENA